MHIAETFISMKARHAVLDSFGFQMTDQFNNRGYRTQEYIRIIAGRQHVIMLLPEGEWTHTVGTEKEIRQVYRDRGPATLNLYLAIFFDDENVV